MLILRKLKDENGKRVSEEVIIEPYALFKGLKGASESCQRKL